MTPDDRPADDPLLARVAAARPPVDDADLSPDGPRAEAILARVLASPRPEPSPVRPPRPAWWSRWRLRGPAGLGALALAGGVAAVIIVLVVGGGSGPRKPALGSHPVPARYSVSIRAARLPASYLKMMDRTALGRAIAQQYMLIQENVDFGTPAQNRRALQQLQFNQAACLHAGTVVAAAALEPGQEWIQYDWVHGIRLQAREDALLVTALRAFASGDRAAGERAETAADNLSNPSNTYTAYPLDWLAGNRLPFPHGTPGLRGPDGRRAR